MHPSFVSDPTAPTVSQLPSSPYASARSYPGPPPLSASATLHLQNGAMPAVIGGTGLRGDERPIRPSARGRYDLGFFDRHNEFEAMTGSVPWIAPRPEEADSTRRVENQNLPALPPAFQRYVDGLGLTRATGRRGNGDAMSDAEFAATFSYERLLELDDALPKQHKGLRPLDLHRVLVSSQQRLQEKQEESNVHPSAGLQGGGGSSPAPFTCSICLETTPTSIPSQPQVGSPAATPDDPGRVVLSCSHIFHFGCIKQWLLTATTCPECRHDLRCPAEGNASTLLS